MTVAALGVNGNTLSLALQAAILASVFVGVLWVGRYRATAENLKDSSDAWKDERDAEKAKADRLDADVRALKDINKQLEVDLADLRARTDLDPLMQTQRSFHQETVAALQRMGEQSDLRHEAMTDLLIRTSQQFETLESAIAGQFAGTAKLLRTLVEKVEGRKAS